MKIIRKMLVHKCMYWSNPVPDGYGGYTFQPPIELKCRWEDINERFITDANTEDLSKSKVYVDRDLMVGGYLLEGLGEDIDLTGNPENITTAKGHIYYEHHFYNLRRDSDGKKNNNILRYRQ